MANFQKGSVCLVCSSNTDNIHNDSNFNSEVYSKFLRFVSRYLSYGHSSFNNDKIRQFVTTLKSPSFSCIKCCDICVDQLKNFLEVYEGFELIQLELFNIVSRISTTMSRSGSGNKMKAVSDFQMTFTSLVDQRRTQRPPVVKMQRLETKNVKIVSTNLFEAETVKLVKREPSPIEFDQPNYQDFDVDPYFETSLQNNATDPFESSENEKKPSTSTLKNVQNELDNETNTFFTHRHLLFIQFLISF